jgi:hypothetical protein
LIAPAQYTAFVAEGVLAVAARMPVADVGFVFAMARLVAVVLRDEWYAHRAATAVFGWEQFESDFRAYLRTHPPDSGGSLTNR